MDWLTDNPIANMYGPQFLLLYGVVIVVTLVVCWVLLSGRSRPSALCESFHDDAPREDWPVRVFGAVVIVGLGGYKLFVALSKGRYNVLFLILYGRCCPRHSHVHGPRGASTRGTVNK